MDFRDNLSWIEHEYRDGRSSPKIAIIRRLNLLVVELAFNLEKYGTLGLHVEEVPVDLHPADAVDMDSLRTVILSLNRAHDLYRRPRCC